MTANLQGHFLVAADHMKDPNFHRTVVLMLEDSEESSMGLVINRPSSIAVDAALTDLGKKSIGTDPIFAGGPVDTSALFVLHNCADLAGTDQEAVPGIYVTGSSESFDALISEDVKCNHKCGFRIFCGYAGWSPGQLASEIARGDWRSIPAESEIVFHTDPYDIWEICRHRHQQANRLLPHEVKNPEWN